MQIKVLKNSTLIYDKNSQSVSIEGRYLNIIKVICAKLLESCLILCHPMFCKSPGSSVPGILQARIVEWVAMPSSRGSTQSRD